MNIMPRLSHRLSHLLHLLRFFLVNLSLMIFLMAFRIRSCLHIFKEKIIDPWDQDIPPCLLTAYPRFECDQNSTVASMTKNKDGENPKMACLSPLRHDLDFMDIGQIKSMIAVDQIGILSDDDTFYVIMLILWLV